MQWKRRLSSRDRRSLASTSALLAAFLNQFVAEVSHESHGQHQKRTEFVASFYVLLLRCKDFKQHGLKLTMYTSILTERKPLSLNAWIAGLLIAAVLWVLACSQLTHFADVMIGLFGLSHGNRLGKAVHFFFYDTAKVLLLLTGILFLMGVIQTFFHLNEPGPCFRASGLG